jgi:type 1 fimbria pilin
MDKKILPNVLVSLLILTTHSSLAETQAKNVNGKIVNAKCHVVLANAKEEILLYRIKAKKIKIVTSTRQRKSSDSTKFK